MVIWEDLSGNQEKIPSKMTFEEIRRGLLPKSGGDLYPKFEEDLSRNPEDLCTNPERILERSDKIRSSFLIISEDFYQN